MDAKPTSQSDQPLPDADAEYNSSEYTHSSLDPTANDAQPDAAPSTADDASRNHAMEAVMQLAQAASQQQYDQSEQHQQHAHVENPDVHHDSLPVNNSELASATGKRVEKRRASTAGRCGSKAARQDDHEDVATAAAAAAAAAAAGGESNLPFSASWTDGNISAEIQKAYQQHLASAANFSSASSTPVIGAEAGTSTSTSPGANTASGGAGSGSPPFKPTRQLSTSKRAAQNRAAQRAFRERRDKYVKVLESKASRLETAVRVATECKRRYVEALQTIDGLRQDNHTLRVALAALSGTSVVAAAPQNRADEVASELPEIPKVTTEEEMEVLVSAQAGAGGSAGALGANRGGQSLDGLSAVAAAAAAVAELGVDKQDDHAKEGEPQQQQQPQQTEVEAENAASAPSTNAEGKAAPAATASTPPASAPAPAA